MKIMGLFYICTAVLILLSKLASEDDDRFSTTLFISLFWWPYLICQAIEPIFILSLEHFDNFVIDAAFDDGKKDYDFNGGYENEEA